MIYMRYFTHLGTNGGSCDPSLEVPKGRRASPPAGVPSQRQARPASLRFQPRVRSASAHAPLPLAR